MAVTLGVCWPIPRSWEKPSNEDFCNPMLNKVANTVLAGINLSNDLLILFLGLHIILSLSLGPHQKVGLLFAAGIGFLSILMGAIRFVFAYLAIINRNSTTLQQYHLLIAVGALELAFAFAAFCLPSFRVLLTRWWSRRDARNSGRKRISSVSGSGAGLAEQTIGGSGRGLRRAQRVDESRGLTYDEEEGGEVLPSEKTAC